MTYTPTPAECREVQLETAREFLRDKVEESSERIVAAECGISRTALGHLIRGETTPHPRIRRLAASYYLRCTQIEDVERRRQAIATLFPGLPETDVITVLEQIYTSRGVHPPRWIEGIRQMAA